MIQVVEVDSSNISMIAYSEGAQLMDVRFNNKAIYRYYEVPQSVFNDLTQEGVSVGSLFHKIVRGHFKYKQIQ